MPSLRDFMDQVNVHCDSIFELERQSFSFRAEPCCLGRDVAVCLLFLLGNVGVWRREPDCAENEGLLAQP